MLQVMLDVHVARVSRAFRRVVAFGALAVIPALVFVLFFVAAIRNEYAFDFHQFWQGPRDVLDGRSPYPELAAIERLPNDGRDLDAHGIQDVFLFPYPAITAIALLPLGALPFGLASAILTAILLGSIAGALWLLDVRDWRCYALTFSSILVLGAVTLGTLTPILLLLLAIVWRYRDRPYVAAGALAAAVIFKLFLLPVVGWLVATRRWKAAALVAPMSLVGWVAGWAAIGWDGFTDYPRLLQLLSAAVEDKSLSLTALGAALDLPDPLPMALALGAGGVLLLAAFGVASRDAGDPRAFVLTLAAALALSPIAWLHYYLLLLVPLALARPRFGPLWLAPALFWITPFQENEGDLWRFAVALCLAAAVVAGATLRKPTLELRSEGVAPARP